MYKIFFCKNERLVLYGKQDYRVFKKDTKPHNIKAKHINRKQGEYSLKVFKISCKFIDVLLKLSYPNVFIVGTFVMFVL